MQSAEDTPPKVLSQNDVSDSIPRNPATPSPGEADVDGAAVIVAAASAVDAAVEDVPGGCEVELSQAGMSAANAMLTTAKPQDCNRFTCSP